MKDLNRCYLYITECADGTYYTGISNNINRRLDEHNSWRGAWYTYEHGPVDLIYFEEYPNRSEAFKRELEDKKLTHNQKKALVDNFFPVE